MHFQRMFRSAFCWYGWNCDRHERERRSCSAYLLALLVINIDAATKSSSDVIWLHGTDGSINQNMSSENQGQLWILPETLPTNVKLKHLTKWYTEVPQTHLPSVSIPESKQPGMIVKVFPPELLEDQDWLKEWLWSNYFWQRISSKGS